MIHEPGCSCCGKEIASGEGLDIIPAWCASRDDIEATKDGIREQFPETCSDEVQWFSAEGEKAIANFDAMGFKQPRIREQLARFGGLVVIAVLPD